MADGKRFMVNPSGPGSRWVDKWTAAELATEKGWVDCTDMSDEEFMNFLTKDTTISE